jgi:tetratricopeptide (TPR) repeat protein
MKKSNVVILSIVIFIAGFIAGLLYAAYKGPPPGLEQRAAVRPMSDHDPGVREPASSGPSPEDMAEVQIKIEALDENIKQYPEQVDLYVQAGNLLFDHDLYERAIDYYTQALKLDPKNPNVLTDVGIAYRRLQRSEKAVEYFRMARNVDPDHQTSALNLGIVLFHDLQDYPGALDAWRAYLAMNPTDPRAEMIRQVVAQLEQQLGDPNSLGKTD